MCAAAWLLGAVLGSKLCGRTSKLERRRATIKTAWPYVASSSAGMYECAATSPRRIARIKTVWPYEPASAAQCYDQNCVAARSLFGAAER